MKKGLDLRPQIQTSDLRDQTSDQERLRHLRFCFLMMKSEVWSLRSRS